MSIGASLLVVALGAILTFAVQESPRVLDLHVVGVVLMIVGGLGVYFRLAGFGPDRSAMGVVTLPRWVRWPVARTRVVEERTYDPMAEDVTLYQPESTTVVRPVDGQAERPAAGPEPVVRPVDEARATRE